ncbi:TIGR00304 family protein [Methanothermococcus sp.]|uniref:TIGR00304 family membrane protein n=1 Tax=Methanothermococcus sp. TaxID=2614238 RepID=UPI0025F4B112|nr:TIGR00304 family protein [Methanothermococcus sp.]
MKPILVILGMFLITIGLFVLTLGMIYPSKSVKNQQDEYNEYNEKQDVGFSGVVMIGPIPIVFGNSPSLVILSVLIVIAMMIWIFLFYSNIVINK